MFFISMHFLGLKLCFLHWIFVFAGYFVPNFLTFDCFELNWTQNDWYYMGTRLTHGEHRETHEKHKEIYLFSSLFCSLLCWEQQFNWEAHSFWGAKTIPQFRGTKPSHFLLKFKQLLAADSNSKHYHSTQIG